MAVYVIVLKKYVFESAVPNPDETAWNSRGFLQRVICLLIRCGKHLP